MAPPSDREGDCKGIAECWQRLVICFSHVVNCFNFWHLFIFPFWYIENVKNTVQPAVPKVSISVFYTWATCDFKINNKKLTSVSLLFLSCVGTGAEGAWDAGARGKTLSPQPDTLLWGGGPSSCWLYPCWRSIFCSQGFHLPGSHWLAVLQVRASHSSISRRLPYTKVCLFPLLFSYCWRYLKHKTNCGSKSETMCYQKVLPLEPFRKRLCGKIDLFPGSMPCCHSCSSASAFHLSLCSMLSLRISQANHLPPNPLGALLLVHLSQWPLRLQPAPWNQSMTYHTSGGYYYYYYILFTLSSDLLLRCYNYFFSFISKFFLIQSFFLIFRSEITNETDRLTTLCVHWEAKVEDESIPEESEFIFSTSWKWRAIERVVPNCGRMAFLNGTSVIRCLSFSCLFSERSYAYSSRPSEAVDEGAL